MNHYFSFIVKIIFLLNFFTLSLKGYALENMQLAQAITALKAGDKSKAYAQLEKKFLLTSDTNEKSKIALMLAIAEQKYIRKQRFEYAEYALRNYRNLESSMSLRLTRIAADGRFDQGNLLIAKKNYQFILASPSSTYSEKEYATYKLGWIYLNESNSYKAFRLWQNWLQQDNNSELYGILLHDAGRAYAEASMQHKNLSLRLQLQKKEHKKAFFSGILSKQDRKNNEKEIVFLLNTMTSNQHFQDFLNYIVEESDYAFANNPCILMDDFSKADFSVVNIEKSKGILQECRKKINGQPKETQNKQLKLLAEIYTKLPGFILSSSDKAESFLIAGKYDRACLEFANTTIDSLRKNRNQEKNNLQYLHKTQSVCSKMNKKNWSTSLEQALRELVEIILFTKPIKENWNSQALILLNKLSSTNKLAVLKEYFLVHSRKPYLNEDFIEIVESLLKDKKQMQVKIFFDEFLPLSKASTLIEMNIWGTILADFDFKLMREVLVEKYENYLSHIRTSSKKAPLSNHLINGALSNLIALNQYKTIIQNIDFFDERLLTNTTAMQSLLKYSIDSDETMLTSFLKEKQTTQSGAVLYNAKLLTSNRLDRVDLNRFENALNHFSDAAPFRELKILVNLKQEELNIKSLTIFQVSSLQKLKVLMAQARGHKWQEKKYYQEAQKSIALIADNMAVLVDALPRKSVIQGFSAKDLSTQLRKTRLE